MFCRCWNISSEVCKREGQEGLNARELLESRLRYHHEPLSHTGLPSTWPQKTTSGPGPRGRWAPPWRLPYSMECLSPRAPGPPLHSTQGPMWFWSCKFKNYICGPAFLTPGTHVNSTCGLCIPSEEFDFKNLSHPKITRHLDFILQPLNVEIKHFHPRGS